MVSSVVVLSVSSSLFCDMALMMTMSIQLVIMLAMMTAEMKSGYSLLVLTVMSVHSSYIHCNSSRGIYRSLNNL